MNLLELVCSMDYFMDVATKLLIPLNYHSTSLFQSKLLTLATDKAARSVYEMLQIKIHYYTFARIQLCNQCKVGKKCRLH